MKSNSQLPKQDILNIFSIWSKQNPNPKCELNFSNNFELLIAVLLSAQATDIGVNKATLKLFAKANTPDKMLALGKEGVKKHIQTIGLYHNKAKHILATCQILINQYSSQIPSTRAQLEQLPGVGRKTANVVLNTAFKHPTIAVDTHVSRVSQRVGLTYQTSPNKIEQELYQIIPKKYQMHAHHWLILHGRYICKANKPLCSKCPIFNYCKFTNKIIL